MTPEFQPSRTEPRRTAHPSPKAGPYRRPSDAAGRASPRGRRARRPRLPPGVGGSPFDRSPRPATWPPSP